jgi:hypothetical protein
MGGGEGLEGDEEKKRELAIILAQTRAWLEGLEVRGGQG